MRVHPVFPAAGLAFLLACNPDGSSSGKADGEPCAAGVECRSGLCFEAKCASSTPPSASCTPPGTPTIVNGGTITATAPPPGACVTAVRDPVAGLGFVDLGEHTVGEQLSFTVPAGTTGFTIFLQQVPGSTVPVIVYNGYAFANGTVPTNVREPDGSLFYSDLEPLPQSGLYDDPTRTLAYYSFLSPISTAFTVPNTALSLDRDLTAGQLPPGTWTFTVNDYAFECLSVDGCTNGSSTGRYHVHVLATPAPFVSTGTMNLEVYLATDAGSLLPNAAAAVANPQFTRWVRSFGTYYAKAGICLGTVTVHDLPDWAKARYAPGGIVDVSGGGQGLPPSQTLPGCDDLSQLFTVGLAQSRAVHIFFADELVDSTSAPGLTVLGVDGSIPGPSGVPGTVNGGAVVGVFDMLGVETAAGACSASGGPNVSACGTDVLALVTAHEAGHWLGLYHTTEFTGTLFDPLSDTDTCACLACAPYVLRSSCAERSASSSPTMMLNSYCSGRRPRCGGGQNLMFWLFDERYAVGDISRQQGDVMRRNPAVN